MADFDEIDVLEATEAQLAVLRELGVSEFELEGMNCAEAEELIAELQAMRQDAGRINHD